MATFPSITPSARPYSPGDFPSAVQSSLSGAVSGYRRGSKAVSQRLSLSYSNLTEAQVTTFRTHYDGQKGSYESFFLSTETWAGYTTPPVPLLSDIQWLYANPLNISDDSSRWNVEVELRGIPTDIGGLIFDGQDASDTWTYTLDAGTSSTAARDYIVSPPGAF